MTKKQIEKLRNERVKRLMNYGYSKKLSEEAFDECVKFWQEELKCDRTTAIIRIAQDNY